MSDQCPLCGSPVIETLRSFEETHFECRSVKFPNGMVQTAGCQARSEQPAQIQYGRINVRVPMKLKSECVRIAQKSGLNLELFVIQALRKAADEHQPKT